MEDRRLLAITGFGVAGDSLSDEYVNETYSYAKNWVELLGTHRSLPLGIYDADDNNWGEPRRKGYEFNWARAGADSVTLLSDGQHTGLATQINANQVSHAVLAIGQNDFLPEGASGTAYFEIYNNNWTQAEINTYVDSVFANISTALQTIRTNNVKLVLSTIADYGVAPLTRLFFPDAPSRQRVTNVIAGLNDRLEQLAFANRIPIVDLFDVANVVLSQSSITVGGNSFSNTPGVGVTNLFVHDGIHPHTGTSGIIANLFLEAFRLGYGEQINKFTEQELVTLLGLPYVSDTLNFNYSTYVDLPLDYGDAPDTATGTGVGNYNTLLSDNGPRHEWHVV